VLEELLNLRWHEKEKIYMTDIIIKSDKAEKAAEILRETLGAEQSRLNYSLQLARKRISQFEKKYGVSSEIFINEWSAEDLEDKDLEYVEWAGEFKLASRLNDRLATIASIEYVSQ
jgi:hypothetical protein